MRLAHHLYQHPSGIYYFRLNVPHKLRPVYGQQQIRQSLHTKDPKLAKLWAYVLSSRFLAEFQQYMPTPKLDEVIRAAREAKRYELTLPNGMKIKAEDEADHSRALEAIGKLDKVGAFQGPSSTFLTSKAWLPVKPLHLSEGIQRHLLALKPHTLPKTYTTKRQALIEFKGWKKDTPVHLITRTDLADFCHYLIGTKLDKSTIVNRFSYLRGFFTVMQEGGFFPPGDNPAVGHIRFTKKDKINRKKKGWEPFSEDELRKIFSYFVYKPKSPHRYWVPWIGLYTGARVAEVSQLAVVDIIHQGGVPCFNFTDEGENQRLKTESSRRVVPIYPKLIELGLLKFVEDQSARGQVKLFPKLHQMINGPGDAMSKAFCRDLGKLSIKPKTGKKGHHSFRKTIIQQMQTHRIPAEFRAQFLGHDLEDEHFQSYSRKYTNSELAEVIFPALHYDFLKQ